ncbi:MAG: hypothetical protein ACXVYI_06075 [Mycobacterium sp.]
MAEAALCVAWGTPARGREKAALGVFNESMQYWERLQQSGKIERFDVAMLAPSGGDLGGFILARGTASQLDALRRDGEFQEILNRVQMIADRVLINDAYVDEGLGQLIGVYDKVVTEFA